MPRKRAPTLLGLFSDARLRRIALDHGLPEQSWKGRKALEDGLSALGAETILHSFRMEELEAVCIALQIPVAPDLESRLAALRAIPGLVPYQPALLLSAPRRKTFVALDFETADNGRDSACQLGLIRVENGVIVRKEWRYIRPPRKKFLYTYIHNITWAMVAHAPTFAQQWPWIEEIVQGADFLAAHNSPFDSSVMEACCYQAEIDMPNIPYVDTVKVARKVWNLRPTRLPDVCQHLGIALNHHDALSDAHACAQIVLAAGADQPDWSL